MWRTYILRAETMFRNPHIVQRTGTLALLVVNIANQVNIQGKLLIFNFLNFNHLQELCKYNLQFARETLYKRL